MLIVVLIFGLIGMLFPGWLMACCGLGSRMEEETCLVWGFRILGAILFLATAWCIVSQNLFGPH